jgi:hypothetical protein
MPLLTILELFPETEANRGARGALPDEFPASRPHRLGSVCDRTAPGDGRAAEKQEWVRG